MPTLLSTPYERDIRLSFVFDLDMTEIPEGNLIISVDDDGTGVGRIDGAMKATTNGALGLCAKKSNPTRPRILHYCIQLETGNRLQSTKFWRKEVDPVMLLRNEHGIGIRQ